MTAVKHGSSQHVLHPRRVFLLRLLSENSPSYDELVRAVVTEFPHQSMFYASARAARSVRLLFWDRLAVTEPDETCWLTPTGWRPVADLCELAAPGLPAPGNSNS